MRAGIRISCPLSVLKISELATHTSIVEHSGQTQLRKPSPVGQHAETLPALDSSASLSQGAGRIPIGRGHGRQSTYYRAVMWLPDWAVFFANLMAERCP